MTDIVNIHQAKTHLSRLVEQAAKGQSFIIAKAGKPMVRVLPLEAPPTQRKLGFMAGLGVIPADIKGPFAAEIEDMFYGPSSGLFPEPQAKRVKSQEAKVARKTTRNATPKTTRKT